MPNKPAIPPDLHTHEDLSDELRAVAHGRRQQAAATVPDHMHSMVIERISRAIVETAGHAKGARAAAEDYHYRPDVAQALEVIARAHEAASRAYQQALTEAADGRAESLRRVLG